MKRSVRFTDGAASDLAAIERWFKQPGAGKRATTQLRAIGLAMKQLVDQPCAYRRGSLPGTREMLSRGHRILYEVRPDTGRNETSGDVVILRVFGPGQLI